MHRPTCRSWKGKKWESTTALIGCGFPPRSRLGARIRSKRTLKTVELKGGMIEAMYEVVVEIEGHDKPACVAESLSRMVF